MVRCHPVFASIVLALLLSSGPTDGLSAIQKSVFNSNTPDLAIDGNPETCAITGFDSSAWLKVDLGSAQIVSGVIINGSIGPFQVKVGDSGDELGSREGFSGNPLCYFSDSGIDGPAAHYLPCDRPITGRYVSVQTVDNSALVRKLSLCEVSVQ